MTLQGLCELCELSPLVNLLYPWGTLTIAYNLNFRNQSIIEDMLNSLMRIFLLAFLK